MLGGARMSKARASLAALLSATVLTRSENANADVQAWSALEARAPVSEGAYGAPTHLRFVSESRFGGPRSGLSFLLVRVGPMWELGRVVLLNANLVQAVSSNPTGGLQPESRVEVEPNLRFRFEPVAFNLRQRAEVRFAGGETTYRYRAQLRANLQPEGAVVFPFLSTELFVDLGRTRLSENRNVLGVAFAPYQAVRIDLGYMLRARRDPDDWAVGHAAVVSFTFAPKPSAVIESGGS